MCNIFDLVKLKRKMIYLLYSSYGVIVIYCNNYLVVAEIMIFRDEKYIEVLF